MKSSSNIIAGPHFDPKLTDLTFGHYIYNQVLKHGSQTALINVDTGEELKYSKIAHDCRKLAVYLKKLGLTVNDRIGICSENNLHYGTAVLSSLLLGVTICPVNPLYTVGENLHILSISKPKYIFVSALVAPKFLKFVNELSWGPKLILLNKSASQLAIPNIYDIINNVSDIESQNIQFPKVDLEDHVAAIFCSSGTTGMPKGVMLTDKNLLLFVKRSANFFDSIKFPNETLTITALMPFFHGYGFAILCFATLQLGVRTVIFSRFEEKNFFSAIEKYKINILTLVPSLIVVLIRSPIFDQYDLSSVRKILTGGAKLSLETEKSAMKRFNLDHIQCAYGSTETTIVITYNHPESHRLGSVGKLEPGTFAKVIPIGDSNCKDALGPNCEGELCFKGSIIMKGYFGDPDSTKNAIDDDGWYHSGDVGYYDEDGFLYIVDRIKELIKYKGYQVAPVELEAILLTHPLIKDAAVVGLPDEDAGELPFAFVVKEPASNLTAEEVVNYVNAKVSPQKRIRGGVKFINEIPKNSTGKVLRRELRNTLKSNL
ncbi:4-coumarate--CoA ligase 1-like [Belonocnema kinseyi]|uniref:4-coumarate--CoA ligase 1-like n=1 Tax=Belonocnema kinseyi TaxID=2817044 RepID=UPI00143D193A|nr:4-coumarate--CoA ligase 1-like [Belonocnema kinseyi]XP_033217624.1 4-coumarate--CoA ligase 1-like [Belonocnema kinseyi]XP_033217625.1 4-coumarate--CoA ligase 1-like [Belonocnema kinseyi]XP_033217626.1 4-coumarate--CoA ligase 1-like [Belonocnema kinseyi]